MYFTSKGILKKNYVFCCDWFVGMVIDSKMLLIVVVFRHQDTMMCGFGRSTSCRRPSTMGGICVRIVGSCLNHSIRAGGPDTAAHRHNQTLVVGAQAPGGRLVSIIMLCSRVVQSCVLGALRNNVVLFAAEPPSGALIAQNRVLRPHLEPLKCSKSYAWIPI